MILPQKTTMVMVTFVRLPVSGELPKGSVLFGLIIIYSSLMGQMQLNTIYN